jgi:xanthine dehydrogenase accessory factor
MLTTTQSLFEFYNQHRQLREPLVLATIVRTLGSTYRKAGSQMLLARDGLSAGLLSGGCAESDLAERAQRVFATGNAELVDYDTRGSDDVIWGIGLGCEGAMRILLTRLDSNNAYQPFDAIAAYSHQHQRGAFAFALEGNTLPLGTSWYLASDALPTLIRERMLACIATRAADLFSMNEQDIFVAPVELPPRLLILGAGADAIPVLEMAALLGWEVHLADHRLAYAIGSRFPRARAVLHAPAQELVSKIVLNDFDAAVVMSHHLPTDQIYLAHLAQSTVRYVGLLGPAARRQRLLAELGELAAQLQGRLAGPVGLDIGAKTPQAIALAIVAEIHAHLAHRSGGSFSNLLRTL